MSNKLEKLHLDYKNNVDNLDLELRMLKESYKAKEKENQESQDLLGQYEKGNNDLKMRINELVSEKEKQAINYEDRLQNVEVKNRGLIDEIKELKSDKEVHLHEIQELKDLVKKYEDQLEKMAEKEHKNTSKFIEHIQRDRSTERNSFAHGSLFRVSPDHFRPRESPIRPRDDSSFNQGHSSRPAPVTFYSPKNQVSPFMDFIEKKRKNQFELDQKQDNSREEYKFSVSSGRMSLHDPVVPTMTRSQPETKRAAKGFAQYRSPISPVDDIQRSIEKLKTSKRYIQDNIDNKAKFLSSGKKKRR
mmetsp:Transcript_14905/g.12679  ORF Transcript_14905/g.12679 Transcript_14905/m.12679 type:complete len:303 (-) Transcript_14905:307-1215(-)